MMLKGRWTLLWKILRERGETIEGSTEKKMRKERDKNKREREIRTLNVIYIYDHSCFRNQIGKHMRLYVYMDIYTNISQAHIYFSIYVCACVCARTLYTYMCVSVCVCIDTYFQIFPVPSFITSVIGTRNLVFELCNRLCYCSRVDVTSQLNWISHLQDLLFLF